MVFTWDDIIDRARTYVDDDHKEEKGWILPERWMTLAQVEYAQLYRRWVRMSLIAPMPVDVALLDLDEPDEDVPIADCLAIIGVAEVTGSAGSLEYRPLERLQPNYGRRPFRSDISGVATGWEAYGTGDAITVKIYPPDVTRTYVVRYIPRPDYETDSSEDVDLPYGGDERLALGLARRAHVKDGTSSSLLNGLIMDADAELNFTAFGMGGGQKVGPLTSTPRNEMPSDPRLWRWF